MVNGPKGNTINVRRKPLKGKKVKETKKTCVILPESLLLAHPRPTVHTHKRENRNSVNIDISFKLTGCTGTVQKDVTEEFLFMETTINSPSFP